ncbi:MAG: Ger(x)C family spore germination protein [Mycobacterium leprae]
MRTRPLLALCLAAALLLTTGCWDMRELNQLALVVAVGIDKADTPGRYLVSVQIARPGSKGKGKGGGQGGAGSGGAVYTASADGDTIFAAIRNLAQFTSRRLMWAHNNVIVIGESLAREDITPVIDFFTRNQELRMRTWIVVARDSDAKEVVAAKTGLEDIPADSISALFRYAQLPGETVRTDMNEVAASFFSPDLNPVISAMQLYERIVPPPGEQSQEHGGLLQVEMRGTALFYKRRLVGYVDSDAGRGLLWLRRQMRNTVFSVGCPGTPGKNMAIEVRSPQVEIQTNVSGPVPVFNVSIWTRGWLMEQDCVTNPMSTADLKTAAEHEFENHIRTSIQLALTAVQKELKTDVLRFGELVHREHPAWWRQNKSHWDDIFPRSVVKLSVTAEIPKMGLYTRPMNFHYH